ncbi:MAG TPA: efflux RND transporter periplasmic adaptor subunit [Casimicrobiaceae bacterium]
MMMRKNVLPLVGLAVAGFGLASVVALLHRGPPAPSELPAVAPAQSPYPTFVAGAGIVEAGSENIAVGAEIGGVVTKIYVEVGSRVKAGEPLFAIDSRAARAEVAQRQAGVEVAKASLAQATHQLALAESVADPRALSVQELTNRRDAAALAKARLAQAGADLQAAQTDLERLTVRAPVDGQVLQLKVHPGEFAATGVLAQPLVLLGSVEPLNVRVDVDENDAWRIKAGAPGVAFLRGNKDIKTPLKFVRFEPYVVPKRSLTGDATERVDTRVLQAIYSFDRGDLPIYVGQQMDVFIEAPGHKQRAGS